MKNVKISFIIGLIFTLTIGITVYATYDKLESSRAKDQLNYSVLQDTQFQIKQKENELSEMKSLEKKDLKTYCLGVQSTAIIALDQDNPATPEQKEKWEKLKARSCENYYTDTLALVFSTASDLDMVFLKSQKYRISQPFQDHFKRNKYMAQDYGTYGEKIELYAPSFMPEEGRDEERTYTVKMVDNWKTMGQTMELHFTENEVDYAFAVGHLNKAYFKTGDTVKTGEKIGLSGGCPSELMYSEVSDGCHVHLEFRMNGVAVPYPTYAYTKHYGEEKKPVDGLEDFLKQYGADNVKGEAELFRKVGNANGIKPEVLVAIANADSSLGRALKTKNNLGNVGNTSDGRTMEFATLELAVEAMAKTLNNEYLKGKTTIGELSVGGGGKGHIYASSDSSWNKNVLASLRKLYNDKTIDESFNFRIQ